MNRDQITFERQMKHSYMRIAGMQPDPEQYETKMLLRSRIPGTLSCQLLEENGEAVLQYDITKVQALEQYLEHRFITALHLEQLLASLDQLLEHLEEYLLPESLVCLDEKTIFLDAETERFYFTCVPGYGADFAVALTHLLAWILKRVDYEDQNAVILAYTLCQVSSREQYCMEDLLRAVRRHRGFLEQSGRNTGTVQEKRSAAVSAAEAGAGVLGAAGGALAASVTTGAVVAEAATEQPVYPQEEIPFFSNEMYAAEEAADGLLCNPADDLLHAGLYEQDIETEPEFAPKEVKQSWRERKTQRVKLQQADKEKRQLRMKLILALVCIIAIPLLLWFVKGAAMFMRMLPLILIIDAGILIVTLLDFFSAGETD